MATERPTLEQLDFDNYVDNLTYYEKATPDQIHPWKEAHLGGGEFLCKITVPQDEGEITLYGILCINDRSITNGRIKIPTYSKLNPDSTLAELNSQHFPKPLKKVEILTPKATSEKDIVAPTYRESDKSKRANGFAIVKSYTSPAISWYSVPSGRECEAAIILVEEIKSKLAEGWEFEPVSKEELPQTS